MPNVGDHDADPLAALVPASLARRRPRRVALGLCVVTLFLVFDGPVVSGAVFLLLPASPAAGPAPEEIDEPLHASALFVHRARRDEDDPQ